MYAAIIDGVIHYSMEEKDGYQKLDGKAQMPTPSDLDLINRTDVLQHQQDITDAALQELILTTIKEV